MLTENLTETGIVYDVNTLEGELLDKAVQDRWYRGNSFLSGDVIPENYSPSTNREHARPIIEHYDIITTQLCDDQWSAVIEFRQADINTVGPTELVAAMRVFLFGISSHIAL